MTPDGTRIDRIELHLDDGYGRPWTHADGVHVRGFAHTAEDQLLEGRALADHLDVAPDAFVDRVAQLTGEFAAVRLDDSDEAPTLAAAVDTLRSMPLFYGRRGDVLFVSDRARWIAERTVPECNEAALLPESALAAEFLVQGYTTGSRTLYPGVLQLGAGEALQVTSGVVSATRHFVFGDLSSPPPPPEPSTYGQRVEEGVAAFEGAVRRMLASVADRPLAIPLSGGMDSRAVAALVKRLGRDDVLCFSYGREGNFEAQRSRRVAETLGLRWTFVPYSPAQWHRWYNSVDYRRFQRSTIQGCNIEHEQDWAAVKVLLERGAVEPDTVFLPGHMGGLLAGSHLLNAPLDLDAPPHAVRERLAQKFFAYWPIEPLSPAVQDAIHEHALGVLAGLSGRTQLPWPLMGRALEQFGWHEKQPKVTINSVRVYEHHGCDWRIPLWDRRVAEFWLAAPLQDRLGRRLYLDILRRIMSDEAFVVPSRPPRRGRLKRMFFRFFDYDYGRRGAHSGPSRLRGLFSPRVADYVRIEHPTVRALTRPRRHLPLQRVPFNGVLALVAVQDVYDELQDLTRR